MIWISGNKGMLGTDLAALIGKKGLPFVASDKETDITDYDVLSRFASAHPGIDWIVNCSGYTAVDKAEEEREKAFLINETGVRNLATIAETIGATLIHISTDYVFDGKNTSDYTEDDPTCPMSVYGASKLAGERAAIATVSRYYIIRTAWLYGIHGQSFPATMLRLFGEREIVKVVADQSGNPTYTADLARMIFRIVDTHTNRQKPAYGIYNFSNAGRTSWFEFARTIYEYARKLGILQREVRILPITTEEYPTKTRRPSNSSLSKEKITKAFDVVIRKWEDALMGFLIERKNNDGPKT
jgi:dTDP-4-dehydrorhamnose reductase